MIRILGPIAMFFGFLSMLSQNYMGAYCCFGYVFILLIVDTVMAYAKRNKKKL